jgi:hypothetical protein
MTLALCVLVGLAVEWVAGWLTHAAKAGPSDVYLVPVVSGIAGALATTFAHRAHADRFRWAVPGRA